MQRGAILGSRLVGRSKSLKTQSQVREAAKRGAPNTVALVARRAQEELRQSHCHGRLPQSISAEGLIQLSRSRRAEKEAEEAAAEAKREAKAANKGDREHITWEAAWMLDVRALEQRRKRNPFIWCDYCYELGICGSHFAETENAALLEHHERIRTTTSSRGRKAAREQ